MISKKLMWILIGIVVAVAVAGISIGLTFGLRGEKRSSKDFDWRLENRGSVLEFVMGDDVDTDGLVLVKCEGGVTVVEAVSVDMVVLPQTGVDHESGLGKNGMFLEAGEKTITIAAHGKQFVVSATVLADSVVEIVVEPTFVFEVGNGERMDAALERLGGRVYATTERGRVLALPADMFSISIDLTNELAKQNSDISIEPQTDVVVLVDGGMEFSKANKTLFRQYFDYVIEYAFEDGVNLPTASGEALTVEVDDKAYIVDQDQMANFFSFDWTDKTIFKSVVSRTDLAEKLPEVATVVLKNGETLGIRFSDGKYIFDIFELENGQMAYAFVMNGGKPMEFGYSTNKQAYVVLFDQGNGEQRFMPFGAIYEVVDGVPSTADYVDVLEDGRKMFVPNNKNNLVFFGEDAENVTVISKIEYQAASSENYVLSSVAENMNSNLAGKNYYQKEDTLRLIAQWFYVVLETPDENAQGIAHFVARDSWQSDVLPYFGNCELETVYIHNYGFVDQTRVYFANGYYYFDAEHEDVVERANVTEIHAILVDGKIAAYAIKSPYTRNLVMQDAELDLFGLDCVERVVVMGDLVVKITEFGTTITKKKTKEFAVEDNLAQTVLVTSGQGDDIIWLADMIDLDNFKFSLVLSNGDVLALHADKTMDIVFEEAQPRVWNVLDFDLSGSAVQNQKRLMFEYGERLYAASAGEHSFEAVYFGYLSKTGGTAVEDPVLLDFSADKILSANIAGFETYIASGDPNEFWAMLLGNNISNFTLESERVFNNFVVVPFGAEAEFVPGTLQILLDQIVGETTKSAVNTFDLSLFVFEKNENKEFVCEDMSAYVLHDGAMRKNGTFNDVYYGAFEYRTSVAETLLTYDGDKLGFDGVQEIWQPELNRIAVSNEIAYIVDSVLSFGDAMLGGAQNVGTGFFGSALATTFELGKHFVVAKSGDVAVCAFVFEIEQNDSAEGAEIQIFVDSANDRLFFADGSAFVPSDFAIGANDFARAELELLSGGEPARGDFAASKLKLVSGQIRPTGAKQTNFAVEFEIELDANSHNKVAAQTFVTLFEVLDVAQVVIGKSQIESDRFLDTFLEYAHIDNLLIDSEFGFYVRSSQGFVGLENYLDGDKLESSILGFEVTVAGIDFAGTGENGGFVFPVLVEDQTGKHYVQILGTKYYVEDDFCIAVQDKTYSRINVNGFELYVEFNPDFDASQEETEQNAMFLDFVLAKFDVSGGVVLFDALEKQNILDGLLAIADLASHETQVFVGAKIFDVDYSLWQSVQTQNVRSTNTLGLWMVDVPTISSAEFVNSKMHLVETQVLSLCGMPNAETMAALDSVGWTAFDLPNIVLSFEIGSRTYDISPLFEDQNFWALASQAGDYEMGYSVFDDGSAIKLNALRSAHTNTIDLQFVFAGIEFEIDGVVVENDFVLDAEFEQTSVLVANGSSIYDGMLENVATKICFASGRPDLVDVEFFADGTSSGSVVVGGDTCNVELALLVGFGDNWMNVWSANAESLSAYSAEQVACAISGYDTALAGSGDFSDRLFAFKDAFFANGKSAVYRIVAQLENETFSQNSGYFGYAAKNFVLPRTVTLQFEHGVDVTLAADALDSVDVLQVHHKYFVSRAEFLMYDPFEFENVELVFESGIRLPLLGWTGGQMTKTIVFDHNSKTIVWHDDTQLSGTTDILIFNLVVGSPRPSTRGDVFEIGLVLATADSLAINVFDYTLPFSGTKSLDLAFACRNKTVFVHDFELVFEDAEVENTVVTFETGHTFVVGQVLSLERIAGFVTSATAHFAFEREDGTQIEATTQVDPRILGLDDQNVAATYEIVAGGAGIRILDAGFALEDLALELD